MALDGDFEQAFGNGSELVGGEFAQFHGDLDIRLVGWFGDEVLDFRR